MAQQQQQQEGQLDQEKFCCSICLDLLKDPVSVPCGHNYCSMCIDRHWNQRNQRGKFSCPQCRETFIPRPELKKNIMLADMMDILRKTEVPVVVPEECYAGPGDVACDFCTGRKLKAVKTCLQCLVSYCDAHLQPHYQSPAFKNHKLIKASGRLQEDMICSHHDEAKKIFCRTDQQCICYLCSMEEHKGHNMISASAEMTERQKEVDTSQHNILERIKEREEGMKVLHQELKSISHSADRALEDSDAVFSELTASIKGRRSEVRKLIRDQQKCEVSRAEELRKRVEQEVAELRRGHAELGQISHTTDDIHFLRSSSSLSRTGESTHPVSSNVRPLGYFEDVTEAVSKMSGKLEDVFKEDWTNIPETVNRVDVLLQKPEPKTRAAFLQKTKLEDFLKIKQIKRVLVVTLFFVILLTHPISSRVQPQRTSAQCLVSGWPEPKTRSEFLRYTCEVTLDPNTAHKNLSLSHGNRNATVTLEPQPHPYHPERFTDWQQVLSREALTDPSGRCYWEVQWSGLSFGIAVSYKDIPRRTRTSPGRPLEGESRFGSNDKSWSFGCNAALRDCYIQYDILVEKVYSGKPPLSSIVGVYLDHSAGNLSFYNVSRQTMTLLHRVHTNFTQPLYAGLNFFSHGETAELREIVKLGF